MYPEHQWKEAKIHAPHTLWKDINDQRKFLEELAIELKIKKLDDWLDVTVDTIVKKGALFVKTKYNNSLLRGTKKYRDHLLIIT